MIETTMGERPWDLDDHLIHWLYAICQSPQIHWSTETDYTRFEINSRHDPKILWSIDYTELIIRDW